MYKTPQPSREQSGRQGVEEEKHAHYKRVISIVPVSDGFNQLTSHECNNGLRALLRTQRAVFHHGVDKSAVMQCATK